MGAVQSPMLEVTPMPELELPRHDIGPASHADRSAHIMAVKHHSCPRERVEVRRFNLRISITPH